MPTDFSPIALHILGTSPSLYWPKLSSVSIPLYFYNLHVQVQKDMRNKKKSFFNTFQEHDFVELGVAS